MGRIVRCGVPGSRARRGGLTGYSCLSKPPAVAVVVSNLNTPDRQSIPAHSLLSIAVRRPKDIIDDKATDILLPHELPLALREQLLLLSKDPLLTRIRGERSHSTVDSEFTIGRHIHDFHQLDRTRRQQSQA